MARKTTFKTGLTIGCAAIALAFTTMASAQQRTFNVPAQDARKSIPEFARQAGVQISAPTGKLRGIQTRTLAGSMDARAALKTMIEGTGLEVASDDDSTIVLRMAGEGPGESGAGSTSPETAENVVSGDDIIVTAQRIQQRTVDVPISLAVISGDNADSGSIGNVAQLLNRIPGVYAVSSTAGVVDGLSIRGLVPSNGTGVAASYVDETALGAIRYAGSIDSGSFDLDRVEVLRGPQGTLFGANALSGAVRVMTKDADVTRIEVKGRLRVGTIKGGETDASGDLVFNLPIVEDVLAVRAFANVYKVGGFIDTTFASAPRKNVNDATLQNYRVAITFQPSDNFKLRLKYGHGHNEYGGDNNALDNLTIATQPISGLFRTYDNVNLIMDWNLPGVTITSASTYLDNPIANNFILAGFLVENGSTLKIYGQEVRLASNFDGPWRFSAGGIYRRIEEGSRQFAPDFFKFVTGDPTFVTTAAQDVAIAKEYAIFGEVSRSLFDEKVELTGGLRYYHDKVRTDTTSGFFPASPLPPTFRDVFSKVTGRFVLNYKPDRNHTFYLSAGNGFRTGQAPGVAVSQTDPKYAFGLRPDTLYSYEAGAKGIVLDGALNYDVAVYYQDWKNIQQFVQLPIGFNLNLNAGSASGWGLEGSINWRVSPAFSVHAGGAWNGLKFDQDGGFENIPIFRKGARINNSPPWNFNIGAEYNTASPFDGVNLFATTEFSYRGRITSRSLTQFGVNLSESNKITRLDAQIGLEADHWSLGIFANNLTNDDGAVGARSPVTGNIANRQVPRTIGLQASFKY